MPSFATLQVLNLVQTTFLLGLNFSLSFISIPSIVLSPSPILAIRQWNFQFHKGLVTAMPLSVSQLILSAVLCYGSSTSPEMTPNTTLLYGVSSGLSLLIFPFTIYFMEPLNKVLMEKRKVQKELHYADLPEKDAGMQTARDHDKVAAWGWYNWFRVAMYAGVVAVNAVAVAAKLRV